MDAVQGLAVDILSDSYRFFLEHELSTLAAALPQRLSAVGRAAVEQTGDFDCAFVFPPVRLQREQTGALISTLLHSPAAVDQTEQYAAEPWILKAFDLPAMETRNRPAGAYVLLYRDAPVPPETRSQASRAKLDRLFANENWNGLTFHEYLVLQRLWLESCGDHRFDHYDHQQMWLPDSRFGDKLVHAHWNPKAQRVEIGWCKPAKRHSQRGAHPTRVIALD